MAVEGPLPRIVGIERDHDTPSRRHQHRVAHDPGEPIFSIDLNNVRFASGAQMRMNAELGRLIHGHPIVVKGASPPTQPNFVRPAMTGVGHGPAFCEQKGTTAEGSRAADRLCKNLDIPVEACGARMPEVSSSAMTRSTPLRAR